MQTCSSAHVPYISYPAVDIDNVGLYKLSFSPLLIKQGNKLIKKCLQLEAE